MKIGDHIKQIREVEKNYKREYVAGLLKITPRAYANIENNITDITIGRLQEIAKIFDCNFNYILNYNQSKKDFYNFFHNTNGNKNTNIMHQNMQNPAGDKIIKLQEELLKTERKRISLLEALLHSHKINF